MNQQISVESIFLAAVEIADRDKRASHLEKACGEDQQMRERVEALLRSHNDAGSFLEKPPAEFVPTIATGEYDTVDDSSGEISLDFLQPSDKPGCLGTLGLYHIVEVVGRGGMGLVLRAHDTKLDRVVAIKVMAPELAANQMAVKRFLREARAAAAVSHDHVVTIHAIDEENKPPFIVMECVDGLSLQEKIDKQGALELTEILRIGMQTAAGLAAAHKQGLVHRDIKPANILLENGVERVKITDFGLARAVDDVSVTQTGQIAGTPQFMSPEQAQGHSIDERSDLFSLGSVLYTICTGRPPFRADNAVAMLRRVTDDDPRPIREVNAEIPDWLEAIIFKLLAKDPSQRFQSAEEVSELLGQHLAHLQHPATVPKPASVIPPKCEHKRRPGPVAMFDTSHPNQPFIRLSQYLTLALVVLGFLIAAGTVVYVVTDKATLVVETNDPGVRVVIEDDGETIQIVNTGIKNEGLVRIPIVLRSGKYALRPFGDEIVEISKDTIILKRGEEVVVRVKRIEAKHFGDEQTTAQQTDYERLQGSWACVKAAMGNKPLSIEALAATTLKFDHDQVEITGLSNQTLKLKYVIGQFREPKWIEFINPDKTADELSIAGIYAFEGESLRIAFDDADRPRPRDFKPTGKHDHFVGTFRRATSSQMKQKPGRAKSGILTHPPEVPLGGVPVGRNLIIDSSLENTSVGKLPRNWSAWLDDGPDFKCEVVEGGVTGKHCLQISGKGTRGVVFCTSVPMDRTKRYALKGSVKLEGDATSWAVIKLNYFNKTGWLGVDDRVGVSSNQSGWQFFEKTDRADDYPEATLMVPTCHIEGDGTAWFDDLELVAYDRDELPADFDKKHGKNYRK